MGAFMNIFSYYIDENLKEVPYYPNELYDYLKNVELELASCKYLKNDIIKKKIELSNYYRLLGNLNKAEFYILDVIKYYIEENNVEKLLLNKLRLAIIYQYKKDYLNSNDLFDFLLENVDYSYSYIDFLFQHHAKNLFDQKKYLLSLKYFYMALDIRLDKNNKELINSTQQAINICKDKIYNI